MPGNRIERFVQIFLIALLCWQPFCLSYASGAKGQSGLGQGSEPTPTPDRLATPVMPAQPTQIDIGRHTYYYHCMPCHGDRGQGLTDEWRQVWEEDHQDCWARGCHGGRLEDEGFPLPARIPAVVGTSKLLQRFPTQQALSQYLSTAHPPQNPGALSQSECQALSAFLFSENGIPSGRNIDHPIGETITWLALALLAALLGAIFVLQARANKK